MKRYEYSIAEDLNNRRVVEHQLAGELRGLPIFTELRDIQIRGDALALRFERELTAQEKTQLDSVVSAHDGKVRDIPNEYRLMRVADLPEGSFEGQRAFVIDGRKSGETEGAGTGVPVYWSQGAWRRFRDDKPVTT